MRKLSNRVITHRRRRPHAESLEPRLLLSAEPVSPESTLIYQEQWGGQIVSPGDRSTQTIEVDGGQSLSLALRATGGLLANVHLRGPDDTVIASQVGNRFQWETLAIDRSGEYTFDVTGNAGSVGDFTIDLFLNASLEDEQFGGPQNDTAASAEEFSGSGLELGGGTAMLAVVGDGGPLDPEDWYTFTLDAGLAASLALSDDAPGSDVRLELYDAKHTLLGVGIAGDHVDQVIPNFVDRTSDALKDTYFARVVAPRTPYRLTLAMNATVELGGGNAFSSAQSIGMTARVLGFVDRELGASINPLSSAPGTDDTRAIPPDPILAVGPDQVITMVNTKIAAHDKGTSDKLYEQDLRSGDGFFGSAGASGMVFDPWVIYDTDSERFFASGVEITSSDTSHLFLAVSKDSTPTSVNEWHKYKIDFTHIPDGTGLGTGAHFPDYPKFAVSQDAIFVSGNYSAITSGHGKYAGVTAIAKAPLLTGDAARIVYQEYFLGFSVFPLQHQGDSSTQYFAESVGTETIRVHAVTEVLTHPRRHTFDIQVDPFSEPLGIPQPRGAVPADTVSKWIMTGVWRGGSGWFGHPITDPALDDQKTVARWYEVSTNAFPLGEPALVQSGNVDPGPGLHTWMPALAVNAAGSMAIGFSLGGPDRFLGAGYTGRLATDPPGTVTIPVYEWVDGRAIYEKIDTQLRNRWGDYSGMVVDPSDDTTFWVFNEYVRRADVWSTEFGSFQIDPIPESDWYRFEVGVGESFTVTTSTPLDGPGLPGNALDPVLELYDPSGLLIALDDNSATDGRNASITHTAQRAGAYRVRLYGAHSTRGNYFLDVRPLISPDPPMAILATSPEPGQRLNFFPETVTVELSEPVLVSSVAASDLSVNGVAATSVAIVDGSTLEFRVDASIHEVDGSYSVEIPAGSFQDLSRRPLQAGWHETFEVDTQGPIIASMLWNSEAFPPSGLLPAGSLVLEGILSEDAFVYGSPRRGPFSPGRDDVSVVEHAKGRTVWPNRVDYDPATMRFTVSFDDPLPEGYYTLTIVSGEGAFSDEVGNGLDGEPLGGEPDGTPTGNGSPGGDYTVNFTLDATLMDGRDFARVEPGGSLVYISRNNPGLLFDETDVDRIRFFAQAGQTIAAKITFTEPIVGTAELVGLTAPIQNMPGDPLVIPPTVVEVDGFVELQLSGNAASYYAVDALINSGLESQFAHGTVMPLDDSRVEIGTGQWAVWGEANGQSSDVDLYTIDLSAAQGTYVEIALKGQGHDLSGATLELLDPLGAVVATASPAEPFDLQILDFAIPDLSSAGRYGLRVTVPGSAGEYLLLVRDGQKLESDPEEGGTPRPLSDGGRAIGYLVSDQIVVVEPDDYAAGTVLTTTVPGVTLSRYTGGNVYSAHVDPKFFTPPTGSRVFGNDIFGPLGFRFGGNELKIEFDEPVAMVSILRGSQIPSTASLITFDEHGNLLELSTSSLVAGNINEKMVVARNQADIYFAVAAGISVVPFDQVTYAPITSDLRDRFRLEAEAGEVITITTDTPPGPSPLAPMNSLDPELIVFHPDGMSVLAQDADSRDGRNARVTFRAPSTGSYLLEVLTTSGTGEYLLEVDRAIPVAEDDAIHVEAGGSTTRLASGATSVLANDQGLTDTPIQLTLDEAPRHAADFRLETDGSFAYTHDGSQEVVDSFRYTVMDYNGQSDSATVRITVSPVGSVSPRAEPNLIRVAEGAATHQLTSGSSSVWATLSGLEDTSFSLSVVEPPRFAVDFHLRQDGTFRYEHDGSENFSDSFAFRITDATGQKKTGVATMWITIDPVSDTDPLAIDDSVSVASGGTATLLTSGQPSVLANDQGLADTPVVVTLDAAPAHAATFALFGDGRFVYEHDGRQNLSDRFVYRITDNDGQASTATVIIGIDPAAETIPHITLAEGDAATSLDTGEETVLALAGGVDEGSIRLSVERPPKFAADFQLHTDGTFRYEHDGSENFRDSFVVRVTDKDRSKKTGTVTVEIAVTPLSDASPLAMADSATVEQGGSVTILDSGEKSLMDNDQGLADTPIAVSLARAPDHAAHFTLYSNGRFAYEHDGSPGLEDEFDYRITDNDGQASTTTVTIRVAPVSSDPSPQVAGPRGISEDFDSPAPATSPSPPVVTLELNDNGQVSTELESVTVSFSQPVDLTLGALVITESAPNPPAEVSAISLVEDPPTISSRGDRDPGSFDGFVAVVGSNQTEGASKIAFHGFLVLASMYESSLHDAGNDTWGRFSIFLLLSVSLGPFAQAGTLSAVDAVLAEDQAWSPRQAQ